MDATRRARCATPPGSRPRAPCVAEDAQTVDLPAARLAVARRRRSATATTRCTRARRPSPGSSRAVGDGQRRARRAGTASSGGAGRRPADRREVAGGPGADVLDGRALSTTPTTPSGVDDRPRGGRRRAGRERPRAARVDRRSVAPGPDVIRAADRGLDVEARRRRRRRRRQPELRPHRRRRGRRRRCAAHGGDRRRCWTATPGDDRLEGGAGNDVLPAVPATTSLDGGPGRDLLRGEAGADVLLARDGERDDVDCAGRTSRAGRPRDVSTRATSTSWCEHVDRSGARGSSSTASSAWAPRLRLRARPAPRGAPARACADASAASAARRQRPARAAGARPAAACALPERGSTRRVRARPITCASSRPAGASLSAQRSAQRVGEALRDARVLPALPQRDHDQLAARAVLDADVDELGRPRGRGRASRRARRARCGRRRRRARRAT